MAVKTSNSLSAKPSLKPRQSGNDRCTETDYMATLLDAVTLDDWREVCAAAVAAAKQGDATARAWLASYLVGKPGYDAQRPLSVVVNKLSGRDNVTEALKSSRLFSIG
jgi:hypothetical protein